MKVLLARINVTFVFTIVEERISVICLEMNVLGSQMYFLQTGPKGEILN